MKQIKQKVKEHFNAFLSQKGLKATLQRNLILDAFLDLDRPAHIDELYLILRSKHSNVGHATVPQGDQIEIAPVLQYLVNPAGSSAADDVVALALRTQTSF